MEQKAIQTCRKSRQLDFYLKKGYIGSLKWKKISMNSCFKLYIYFGTNKTLIHHSLYVFDNWGGGEFKYKKKFEKIKKRIFPRGANAKT